MVLEFVHWSVALVEADVFTFSKGLSLDGGNLHMIEKRCWSMIGMKRR